MVVGWGQECDEGYVWIDEIPVDCESDGNCFYQSDLDVLQEFIDLNESLSGMELLEVGWIQYWNEGRFIGEENRSAGSTEDSFKSVSFRTLNETPAQRIEQVTLRPLTSDPMWQEKS